MGRQHPIQEIVLIPSGNGRYEVMLDDTLLYSKTETGKHTANEYIIEQVRKHLKHMAG